MILANTTNPANAFQVIAAVDCRLEQLAKLMAAVEPDEFAVAMPLTRQIIGPSADPRKQPIPALRSEKALRCFNLEISRRLKLGAEAGQ